MSDACKWCGDNPGTGRPECNRCRRIWLAGYEAARKQAAEFCVTVKDGFHHLIEPTEFAAGNFHTAEWISMKILAMQPEKP